MRSKIKKLFLIIIGGIRADIVKSILQTLHNDLINGCVVLSGKAFKLFDNINGNTEGLIYGLIALFNFKHYKSPLLCVILYLIFIRKYTSKSAYTLQYEHLAKSAVVCYNIK